MDKLEQHNQRLYQLERWQTKMNERLEAAGINGHSVDEIDTTLQRICKLLDGDEQLGYRGLRQQVEEVRQRQQRQDRILAVVIGLLVLLSLAAVPDLIVLAARLFG